jgi:hypothetical protein
MTKTETKPAIVYPEIREHVSYSQRLSWWIYMPDGIVLEGPFHSLADAEWALHCRVVKINARARETR